MTVRVEGPEPPITVAGLHEPVAPGGKPLAVRFTLPVNPPSGVSVSPKVVVDPAWTV